MKMFLIITIAFVLGFLANDYLGDRLDDRLADPFNNQIGSTIPDSDGKAGNNRRAIAEVNSETNENFNALPAPNFSWERVHHSMALTNYDEVINLLKEHLQNNAGSAQAWLLLATSYQKQGRPVLAMDAWFHYLKLESDAKKLEQAVATMKAYLISLFEKPSLFAEDFSWLAGQINTLLNFSANDSELHVLLASVYSTIGDDYQAQYHALMAVNDPATKKQAEDVLAKLSGNEITKEVVVPLTRFGNQFLVTVMIEGNPARLLLDTGASISGVTNDYVNKYPGIVKATKPIRMNTAGGVRDTYLFTVDNLSINNIVFSQHILSVLPMDNISEFDGLFGIDILGRYDFIVDQNSALLRLNPRK